jgi:4-hydroxybenzoate polyprenyltransferase
VAYQWFAIIGLVVFTTIQAQDIHDQAGDSLRNRQTFSLVFGDLAARWTVAFPLWIWSWLCPLFWKLGIIGFLAPVLLATVINLRYLLKRSISADKVTFRIYNTWIVSLYTLPLVARAGRYQEIGFK